MQAISPVTLVNSVGKLYDGVEPKKTKDGFECPICKRTYAREGNAINHLKERNCYKAGNLFKNTEIEKRALKLYQAVMAEFHPTARTSISPFRKSKYYNQFLKYTVFCLTYEVKAPDLYFVWMRDIKNFKHINSIISNAMTENLLLFYRVWLMQNPEFIDSGAYAERDCTFEDQLLMVRTLEKAHVSIIHLMDFLNMDIDEILDRLDADYAERVKRVYEYSMEG